jgi:hypothetical protein
MRKLTEQHKDHDILISVLAHDKPGVACVVMKKGSLLQCRHEKVVRNLVHCR